MDEFLQVGEETKAGVISSFKICFDGELDNSKYGRFVMMNENTI